MKKGIHIMNPKKQNKYMSPYYFFMSSCRVYTNSGQKSLTMFISSCFNNDSIEI